MQAKPPHPRRVFMQQRHHPPRHARLIVGDLRDLPLGPARLAHHPACPPLRDTQPRPHLHHGRASSGRAQKFPEATSLRMAVSKAWSATTRLRRAFSFSSSLSRLAWSSRNPPYSRRQR